MKVKFQGREVEATEVEVVLANEKWNDYQLSDGRILMFKEVMVAVYKLEGEKTPDGNPVYQFQTRKVVRVKE